MTKHLIAFPSAATVVPYAEWESLARRAAYPTTA